MPPGEMHQEGSDMTTRKQDMEAALHGRQPEGAVPIWEIHFHCWEKASGRRFISGRDFEALTAAEREPALREDAETMISVAEPMAMFLPC